MGNRWQRIWGVSWVLLGLWSTSWPSLWWCSTRESYLLFSAVMCKTKLCYYRDVRYTVMILFYNLSACVCDWSLGTHELVYSILSLKLGVTLTQLEICFPSSCFDIMTHLIVHMLHHIRALYPCYLHEMWMHERSISVLNYYILNHA